MTRLLLIAALFIVVSLAQNIKWTGLEGGWIELSNTDFDTPEKSKIFRPSQGQTVRRLPCGSEGASVSPSGPRGSLTWSVNGAPTFTEIYVKVRFGFIDTWQGEEAFISVNGVKIWTKTSTIDRGTHNIHVCGRASRADELVTIERRLRLTTPAQALTVVIGSNSNQNVDAGFFVVSEFVVYAHGGNGAPFSPSSVSNVVNVVNDPASTWETVYTSSFTAGVQSGWTDVFNNAVLPYTCGSEGLTLRQGTNNHLQWQSPVIGFNYDKVRIYMRLGFIDSWDDETATLTLNGQEIWHEISKAAALNASPQVVAASGHTSQVCGDSSRAPRSNDRFVDVARQADIVPTNDRRITLRVSSNLDQPIDNESYVISNIRVEVRRTP